MKTILILILLIVIDSCNSRDEGERRVLSKGNNLTESLDHYLNSLLSDTNYINLISTSECFECSPVYSNIAQIFAENPARYKEVWYIFPAIRPVLYKSFIENNFHRDYNENYHIFNDTLFNALRQKYDLSGSSYLICINAQQEILWQVTYKKVNVEDFKKYLNNW